MTPIGSALLRLLVGTPGDWVFTAAFDGVRHKTGVILATGSKDCVIVVYDTEYCSDVLSDEDHAALYRQVAPMIDAAKATRVDQHKTLLASVLHLETFP